MEGCFLYRDILMTMHTVFRYYVCCTPCFLSLCTILTNTSNNNLLTLNSLSVPMFCIKIGMSFIEPTGKPYNFSSQWNAVSKYSYMWKPWDALGICISILSGKKRQLCECGYTHIYQFKEIKFDRDISQVLTWRNY